MRGIVSLAVFMFASLCPITLRAGQCIGEEGALTDHGVGTVFIGHSIGLVERFSVSKPLRLDEIGVSWVFSCADGPPPCDLTIEAGTAEARVQYDAVAYASDGPDGGPGTLLTLVPREATFVPQGDFGLPALFYKTDVSSQNIVVTDDIYVGALWGDDNSGGFFLTSSITGSQQEGTYASNREGVVWHQDDGTPGERFNICASFQGVIPENIEPPAAVDGTECDLDPSKPTVVLVHGLQPSDTDRFALWTGFGERQAGSLIREQFGDSINVCKWVWEGAFQEHLGNIPIASSYLLANENVSTSAQALATYLTDNLGTDYDQPAHFIGHSLGVVVGAYALSQFLEETSVFQVQFTALDRPQHILKIPGFLPSQVKKYGYGPPFLENVLGQFILSNRLKVENYYSTTEFGVGDIAVGSVYNQELVDPGKLNNTIFAFESVPGHNHLGVHQFLRWTIDSTLRAIQEPALPPCIGDEFSPVFQAVFEIDDSLRPCGTIGWQWSVLVNPSAFPEVLDPQPSFLSSDQIDIGSVVDIGCTTLQSDPPTIRCAEVSSSSLTKGATTSNVSSIVPLSLVDARYLRFDFRFQGFGDGDFVSVAIDAEPVWLLPPDAVSVGVFHSSGLISLGTRSEEVALTITLHSTGSAGLAFEIQNLEVISGNPIFLDGFESGDTSVWSGVVGGR